MKIELPLEMKYFSVGKYDVPHYKGKPLGDFVGRPDIIGAILKLYTQYKKRT